jgi:hypothetical protein
VLMLVKLRGLPLTNTTRFTEWLKGCPRSVGNAQATSTVAG